MLQRVSNMIFHCLLLLCYAASAGQLKEEMQSILDAKIDQFDIHGVSASMVFPDGEVWNGVSGYSHDAVPMNPDMVFGIGSITKNFVAALTLKLAEQNLLSLEDTLSTWLPPHRHIDGNITIRQLLNHTSGLYMFWDNQELWEALKEDRSRVWSPEAVLKYIKEPYFKPGEGFRYSNTNYLLLGMIVEKATNSTLLNALSTNLWEPLGLQPFYLSQENNSPPNQAHVYGDDFIFGNSDADVTFEPRASHESITFGSSGIFTTSENLARWCHSLFNGQVLEPHSLSEMLQFLEFKPVANMRAYGLGVQAYVRSFSYGKEAIGHGGANIGSSTYMVFLPDNNISIVVMINAYPNKGIDAITKGLIRTILRDSGAIGLIPYFGFFPVGLILTCATLSASAILFTLHAGHKRSPM